VHSARWRRTSIGSSRAHWPPDPKSIEDAIRAEERLIGTFDWSEFFESVSLVEQVLQRDPAGVYSQMDFRSRDRYRHAVEELADPTGENQLLVCRRGSENGPSVASAPRSCFLSSPAYTRRLR